VEKEALDGKLIKFHGNLVVLNFVVKYDDKYGCSIVTFYLNWSKELFCWPNWIKRYEFHDNLWCRIKV